MTYSKHSTQQKIAVLNLYLLLFFIVWTLYHFLAEPYYTAHIQPDWLCTLWTDGVLKNLIWTLPAFCLLKHFSADVYIDWKTCFRFSRKVLSWWLAFVLIALYLLLSAYRQNGSLSISSSFGLSSVITVLFVGLTEELVFRGWLLNLMYSEQYKWLAIGGNAILFLLIHFPKWIVAGTLLSNFTSLGFLSILILSVLFSVSFLRTKCLWLPIALHMFWDLLIFMFY